jgi:hypothetical protein
MVNTISCPALCVFAPLREGFCPDFTIRVIEGEGLPNAFPMRMKLSDFPLGKAGIGGCKPP